MSAEDSEAKRKWRPSLTFLKWVAIVLPFLFLISVDVLRHTLFYKQLHSHTGFLVVYGATAVAVVIFSYVIFGFIGRLQRRIIDQNRQLSALNSIATAAAAKVRLQELLDTSLDHILSNMKADAGLVCLVDLEREEHSVVCHRGYSAELVRRLQRAKLRDDPVAREVVRTGHPVIFERVFEDPKVAERARVEGIRSGVSVPLKSEGEVNGILAISTHQERHFSDQDKEVLAGIGGQLGLAIRNAVLYEQASQQNRELSAFLAVGKIVTSSHTLDESLSKSLDTIIEVTSAEAAEVWLLEGEEELVIRAYRGAHREAFFERTRFRLGEGIPGIVGQSRESVVVHNLPSDSRFLREGVVRAGFHTFCALPLVFQDKLLGVLAAAALSPDALRDQRELRLLDGIGEWLALAAGNARLYQQVQDLAVLQERERIAREMHDGMAQLLGYINTQTIAVKKLVADEEFGEARAELTKMEEIARDLYADVREGILGLRTGVRRYDGLLSALREYTARYTEMSGIPVEVKVSPEGAPLQMPPSVEIQAMRIIQEALTNVRKHGKATAASICFETNSDGLLVTVGDNGRGFDPARLPSKGWPRFGLQSMRERAEAVGGTFSIDSEPGRGTRVQLRIPNAGARG